MSRWDEGSHTNASQYMTVHPTFVWALISTPYLSRRQIISLYFTTCGFLTQEWSGVRPSFWTKGVLDWMATTYSRAYFVCEDLCTAPLKKVGRHGEVALLACDVQGSLLALYTAILSWPVWCQHKPHSSKPPPRPPTSSFQSMSTRPTLRRCETTSVWPPALA